MEAETYPLILDGTRAGEVIVRREGGWTVFDVRSVMLPDVVRVSVYGGGREGYLGVLAPEGDQLTLHRRLSRSAMRDFPAAIESAGRSGLGGSAAAEASETEPAAEAQQEAAAPDGTAEQAPQAAEEGGTPREDGNEEAPPRIEDVYWYASPDGALVCFDGTHNLIALPVGDQRIPEGPGGWPQEIEGREYIVYRTKNGRLLR